LDGWDASAGWHERWIRPSLVRLTNTGIAIALSVCTAGCGTYATETWIA